MTLEIVAVKQNQQPTPATAPQQGKAKQKPSQEKLFTAIARAALCKFRKVRR